MLIALGEIESELTSKKYGLVLEQHEEAVDVMMRDHIPVFTEVPEREITAAPGQGYNFILEGDNLHSLRLLEKTHKGRIDVIYIDPPYNTGGKDFTYDDQYVDGNDAYRHSKWVSFMAARLRSMRELLSKTGVIFISIGEQEVASLKMLCDEIFGEDNGITIFSRQMKSGGAKGKFYTPNIDYILAYAKNISELPNFRAIMTQKQIDVFYSKTETEGDRAGEVYGEERLFKASLDARPNQRYYIQCPDGSFAIPPGEHFPAHLVEGETVLPSGSDKVWKWIYPRYKAVSGDAGSSGRGVSRGKVSALRGAFLPKRILCCTQIQGQKCGEDAQGNPRPGEQESVPGEGRRSDCRAEGHEAAGGCEESSGWY